MGGCARRYTSPSMGKSDRCSPGGKHNGCSTNRSSRTGNGVGFATPGCPHCIELVKGRYFTPKGPGIGLERNRYTRRTRCPAKEWTSSYQGSTYPITHQPIAEILTLAGLDCPNDAVNDPPRGIRPNRQAKGIHSTPIN